MNQKLRKKRMGQYNNERGKVKKILLPNCGIKDVEKAGANVEYLCGDVADEKGMKEIFAYIKDKYKTINGVVHSAGVGCEGFLLGKEERVFNNVFDPKVKGTWLIDKLTENEPLDFFVMFSSTASIFSEPGQGDYAAANSFLDSYTAYRNKLGKRTVTISWTAWRDIGKLWHMRW